MAWRCRRCGRKAAAAAGHRAQPLADHARPADRGRPRRARLDDGARTALVHGPAVHGRLPGRRARASWAPTRRRCRAGDCARHRARHWTSWASTTTPATCPAPPSRRQPPGPGAWLHRHGLGGLARRADRTCCCGCTATTRLPPIYVTENGVAFKRHAGRRPRARRRSAPTTSQPSDRRLGRRAGTRRADGRLLGAGACSTTSSGPRATPSASAWCTWTTRRSAHAEGQRAAGTATSSRCSVSGTKNRSL